ncbi:MAG: methyl-accepting chemotaxis protein [Brevinema sp.]
MSTQEHSKNYHHQLQENLLFKCNILFIGVASFLGISEYFADHFEKVVLAILVGIIFCASLFLLRSEQYTSASFMTSFGIVLVSYGILIANDPHNSYALFEYVSFVNLAIITMGFFARQRFATFVVAAATLALGLFYTFSVQLPLLGPSHIMNIVNPCSVIFMIAMLADNIYMMTTNIFNKYMNENITVQNQKHKIEGITSIYNYNKEAGIKLDEQYLNQDNYLVELNDLNEHIVDQANSLATILSDLLSLNEKHLTSSQNITLSFSRHKRNMENYKDQLQEISDTSQEIDTMFQGKRQQLAELIDISHQGQDRMSNSINAVKKVTENSKNILDMISLIMEVAERTNVLALNAAVEASRAGKAGGGFAIVAKEIKKLSTETSHNADIINKTLRINMQSIEETVETIQQTDESLSAITVIIEDFSETIESIMSRISFLTNQSIQMSIGTTNIISIIGEVQQVITNTAEVLETGNARIDDMQGISKFLSEKSKQLQSNTNYIKTTTNRAQQAFMSYSSSIKEIEDKIADSSDEDTIHAI